MIWFPGLNVLSEIRTMAKAKTKTRKIEVDFLSKIIRNEFSPLGENPIYTYRIRFNIKPESAPYGNDYCIDFCHSYMAAPSFELSTLKLDYRINEAMADIYFLRLHLEKISAKTNWMLSSFDLLSRQHTIYQVHCFLQDLGISKHNTSDKWTLEALDDLTAKKETWSKWENDSHKVYLEKEVNKKLQKQEVSA